MIISYTGCGRKIQILQIQAADDAILPADIRRSGDLNGE
jgi:hypothetical protein